MNLADAEALRIQKARAGEVASDLEIGGQTRHTISTDPRMFGRPSGVHEERRQRLQQVPSVPRQPLLRPLGLGAQALYSQPEPCRMVRYGKVNGLVNDDVPKHEVRREYQPPVER